MAEHTHSGPAELGASMDYAEHNRTFAGFVTLTKVGTLATVATLQSLTLMAVQAHGLLLGVLLLALIVVALIVTFVTRGSIKALVGVIVLGFLFMALASG